MNGIFMRIAAAVVCLSICSCSTIDSTQNHSIEDIQDHGMVSSNVPEPGPNGEVFIVLEPCITPTIITDYRELLPPGSYVYGHGYYIKGYDIEGASTPTPVPPSTGDEPVLIDPLTARLVYTSYQPCTQP